MGAAHCALWAHMQAAAKLVDDSIKKGSSSQACAGQVAGALGLAYLEAGQTKEALKALRQAEKVMLACRAEAESPALQALDEARVCTGKFNSRDSNLSPSMSQIVHMRLVPLARVVS